MRPGILYIIDGTKPLINNGTTTISLGKLNNYKNIDYYPGSISYTDDTLRDRYIAQFTTITGYLGNPAPMTVDNSNIINTLNANTLSLSGTISAGDSSLSGLINERFPNSA